MENIRELLDIKLLSQTFNATLTTGLQLDSAKLVAGLYANLENCISVLSDMKARKSYIYYGAVAAQLKLNNQPSEINSIWEDELLSRVHADDLQKKYRLELQFFQLLNTLSIDDRHCFEVITRLRVKIPEGKYIAFKHRLMYINSSEDESIWLALCLYNRVYEHSGFAVPDGVIINNRTGEIIDINQQKFTDILSAREKEILHLVKLGCRSKEIADQLSLSINTINRHRQNIFQKLNVTNAIEACRVAEGIGAI
ncbi:response regulator transcription factor [Mucilaginibacter sp. KACC 22063]|uniref:response regulator transcription factor n=1 Tax=Mucilaginibacter sp. KACC 22063 TaxID=3025666 RepID=UPI0023653B51|nr:helix-turn-helix transcriptional regulator [Mucilaginibacter sp. KACC 22063]WDF53900.1 helix-turn-helix transcriptional regulator [Mucilaginibacter sp. KACC 22063]